MGSLTLPSPLDRLLSAFRALVRAEDPNRTYRGIYEYIVGIVSADGSTVDATPTDTTSSLPAILRIPVLTGLPGGSCKVALASRLGVGFLNGDPTKPVVMGVFDATTAQSVSVSAILLNLGSAPTDGIVLQTLLAAQHSALQSFAVAVNAATSILAAPALGGPVTALPGLPAALVAVTTALGVLTAAFGVPNYSATCKASK